MLSSSIYNYTQIYLAPKEKKQYQAKTTVTGRDYFLYTLPLSTPHLSIDDNAYRVIDQHLSIHKKHQDNTPGLEAYHLTIRVVRNGTEFIIHCYFDSNGNFTGVTMKQGDTSIELSPNTKKTLQDYAIQSSGHITTLNMSLIQKQSELLGAIANKQQQAEKLSEDPMGNIKPYIAALRELINLIKEFNFITNNSKVKQQNILEEILSACEQKQDAIKNLATKKSKRKNTKPKKDASPVTEKEAPTPKEQEEKKAEIETLETINPKLASLKDKNDLASLLERQRLLNIKLKIIPKADFNNTLAIMQELYKLADQIPERTFELALQGSIEAAHEIIANNYFISFIFYFNLIHHEQEKVFDILFNASLYKNFLVNMQALMPDHYNMPVDMLTIAYHKRNESLFTKLLFTYHCDYDLMDFSGRHLLHEIAVNGDTHYAEKMLVRGANINIMVKKVGEVTWVLQPSAPLSVSEKKHFQKTLKEETPKQQKAAQAPIVTPLMEAAYHSQDKMVRWLIEHKADVSLRGAHGVDAIGYPAATKGRPLHAPTLLALLEGGASIDSINSISDIEQANPLHYRCQWLDEESVKLLVNQFAADPNILVKKRISDTEATLVNCLTEVTRKATNPATQEEAKSILFFLLHQDIRPLGAHSLSSSFKVLQLLSSSHNTASPEQILKRHSADIALTYHAYDAYCHISQELISTNPSEIAQAILRNIMKLDLIKAAEENLAGKHYQLCINACQAILRAKFTIEQYNERLWGTYYQAYLGLGDDENACKALEHYLRILTQKSAQVLSPKYKAEVNKKIAIANTQLAEIHEKLLVNKAKSPVSVMHPGHLFHSKLARIMTKHKLSTAIKRPESP